MKNLNLLNIFLKKKSLQKIEVKIEKEIKEAIIVFEYLHMLTSYE